MSDNRAIMYLSLAAQHIQKEFVMSANQLKLLCLKAVMSMMDMSKTSIYCIKDFPKPVKIHGTGASAQSGSRWVEAKIQQWCRTRIEMRDAKGV